MKETFAKTNDNGDVVAAALERLSPEKGKKPKNGNQHQSNYKAATTMRARTRVSVREGEAMK